LIAASGGLARLIVILGLLVGLTALQGTHSSQELHLVTHTTMCPTVSSIDAGIEGDLRISQHSAVLYQALTADPHFPIGAIAMCVALLVSVLLLMIGIGRPGFLGIAPLCTGAQRAVQRRVFGGPSLAMICVLRT
jgi:hypothetical protein